MGGLLLTSAIGHCFDVKCSQTALHIPHHLQMLALLRLTGDGMQPMIAPTKMMLPSVPVVMLRICVITAFLPFCHSMDSSQ